MSKLEGLGWIEYCPYYHNHHYRYLPLLQLSSSHLSSLQLSIEVNSSVNMVHYFIYLLF